MIDAAFARADIVAQSGVVVFLAQLVPVAMTVAATASWRQSVPGAALIAAGGAAYCLWLLVPVQFALAEARQLSQYVTILGWVWLAGAWGRHVLTEWPVPIWGHWLAGTVLLALTIAVPVVLIFAG